MEEKEPRIPIGQIHYSFYEAIANLPMEVRDRLLMGNLAYQFYGVKPQLEGMENSLWVCFKPNVDKIIENYFRKAGAPKGNSNARKTIKTISENNKNNYSELFSEENQSQKLIETNNQSSDKEKEIDKENNKDKENKKEKEEEEEDKEIGRAESSSSSSANKDNFSPIDYIKLWWNRIASDYPHLKKIEFISKSLEEKIINGYNFALDCNDENVERAKNMLAKAVLNMATSDFFKKSQGKATLTWLFATTDNLEKVANGQYNDEGQYE